METVSSDFISQVAYLYRTSREDVEEAFALSSGNIDTLVNILDSQLDSKLVAAKALEIEDGGCL